MKKRKEAKSLKNRLMMFILLCWIVPILTFFIFTSISYQNGIIEKSNDIVKAQLENTVTYFTTRIGEVITACQSPSYEKSWESWWSMVKGNESPSAESDYLKSLTSNLRNTFYSNERFNTYAYYLNDKAEPALYSSRAGLNRTYYDEKINNSVRQVIALASNYTILKVIDGRLFVIRNLFTTEGFEQFGSFVVEVNLRWVFRNINQELLDRLVINFNDTDSSLTFSNILEEKGEAIKRLQKKYSINTNMDIFLESDGNYLYHFYQKKFPDYHLGLVLLEEQNEIYSSLYDVYIIGALLLALFIPIIIYGLFFLRREIQEPIRHLVVASKEMEEGNIGVEIKDNPMPNEEFNYLMYSFNSMSAQLKYLFDKVYAEKLARKDAQIAALQAQINPHFLNNTLEMINWQARMNKDTVISKMIEALGTVLDYRMNRSNVREICLWEELRCADAYLYIMSMRYGQRLQVEQEVDEKLKSMQVPPLIIQPLMENAIVHGVDIAKSGSIKLRIYHDQDYVYLKVENTGKELTKEDMDRINLILSGDRKKLEKKSGRHTSIGIYNVNLRIKLVYGEEYGLTISQEDNGVIVSTILLPFCEENTPK